MQPRMTIETEDRDHNGRSNEAKLKNNALMDTATDSFINKKTLITAVAAAAASTLLQLIEYD